MNLRDHDRDCVHGFHVSHNFAPSDFVGVEDDRPIGWCPGGAAVPIDYEAATTEAQELLVIEPLWDVSATKVVVDAALGLTDD